MLDQKTLPSLFRYSARLYAVALVVLFLQAGAASAATLIAHIGPQRVVPQRILDQSPGNVVSTSTFESQLTGFPWNLSRNVRFAAFSATGASVLLTNWVDEEVRGTGGLVRPALGILPNQECLFPGSALQFICRYSGTNRWGDFTEDGLRYFLVSEIGVSAGPVGFVGNTVSIDGATLNLGTLFPPDATGGLPGAAWTPRCISDRPHWQTQQQRCTCDTAGTNQCGQDPDGDDDWLLDGCLFNPDRMIRVGDSCECKRDYVVPVIFAQMLVDCLTPTEEANRTMSSFSHWGWSRSPRFSRVEWTCTVSTYEEIYDPQTGELIDVEAVSDCRFVFVDDDSPSGGGFGGLTGSAESGSSHERLACWTSETRVWEACQNDPTPHLPIDYPPVNLRPRVPVCQCVDGPDWCEDIDPPSTGEWGDQPGDDPDYFIEGVSALAADPRTGDEVTFFLTVRNAGAQTAPSTHYRVHLRAPDGSTYERDRFTGSLTAGGERLLSVPTGELGYPSAQAGQHTLTLTVDPLDEVAETHEFNNLMELRFDVLPGSTGADLRVTHLAGLDANPPSGERLQVTATVRNSGSWAAGASRLLVVAEHESGLTHTGALDVQSLSPGQSVNVVVDLDLVSRSGRYLLEAFADAQDVVAESDESNNHAARLLDVADGELECLPCTTGMPDNAVGDRICYNAPSNIPFDGIVMTCRGVRSDGSSCANDPNNANGWENTGSQCAHPSSLPTGLHPNRCGTPNVCPGTAP